MAGRGMLALVVGLALAVAVAGAVAVAPPPLAASPGGDSAREQSQTDAHARETVVPAAATGGLRELPNGEAGSTPAAPAPAAAGSSGGGGDVAGHATRRLWRHWTEGHAGTAGKPLWPLSPQDWATLAVILFCLSFAGGAGIGGGAILVPTFILIRGWPTPVAVAFSNVTCLGGSLANFLCNCTRRRADGRRAIDWHLILMMEPTTILGAIAGALLNKLVPVYVTTFLLTLLLSFLTWRLYTKGREAYRKETALLLAAAAAAEASAAARPATLRGGSIVRRAAPAGAAEAAAGPSFGGDSLASPLPSALVEAPSVAAAAAAAAAAARSSSFVAAGRQPRPHLRDLGRTLSFDHAAGLSRSLSRRLAAPLLANPEDTGAALPLPLSSSLRLRGSWGPFSSQAAATTAELLEGQPAPPHVVSAYERSVLFQGDVGYEDSEPMVALPSVYSLAASSSGGGSDGALSALADDDGDEEDGGGGGAGNDDGAGGRDDVRRPLLADTKLAPRRAQAASKKGKDKAIEAAAAAAAAARAREPALPLPHFLTIVGLTAWVIAADIAQANFECGSWRYWATSLSVVAPSAVIVLATRAYLLRHHRHHEEEEEEGEGVHAGQQRRQRRDDDNNDDDVGAAPSRSGSSVLQALTAAPEGELRWTPTTTILFPLVCTSAGLVAGLFGIGGGVVKGPLMLELGVPADVAAATSATMIMFTASSACVVYAKFGALQQDYAAALAAVGFCITLCSQLLTFMLVRLLGRRSVITMMMTGLMAVACLVMLLRSGIVARELWDDPSELSHFGALCPPPPPA